MYRCELNTKGGSLEITCTVPLILVDTGYDHVLTDDEYRLSMGQGYVFFEITEPEELAFTYKVLEYSTINQS